ncbi:MAG: tetratricopeptide repeat protein [Anaerolineae bacterium]|nr:tetratricopeptide repeat protein [Anaerolineae bacterium]
MPRPRAGWLVLMLIAAVVAGFALLRLASGTLPAQTPPPDPTRTLDELDAAIVGAPDDPALYIERGRLLLLVYEWDRALADFNRALELDPDDAEAYYQRGLLYASAPDGTNATRQQAIDDFRRFLDLAPEDARRARAAEHIRRLEAALAG